jgi:hypothetical protein
MAYVKYGRLLTKGNVPMQISIYLDIVRKVLRLEATMLTILRIHSLRNVYSFEKPEAYRQYD